MTRLDPLPPNAAIATPTPLSESAPRSAWLLLALLILLNVINFVDRQLISSLQIPLREDPDLRLTNVQNQLLTGYAFSVVYALAGLYLGTLADRWNRPRLLASGLLVWSAMTAATGMAGNFWQMGLARIFVAFGEATLTPAAVAMLGDVFRPRQRALATGLYYLGIPLGASCSLIVANLLWPIPWIGWRGCFFILGAIGITLVVPLLFLKDPRRGGTEDQPVPALRESAGTRSGSTFLGLITEVFATLRRAPALPLTMVGAMLINISVGAGLLDPSWLNAERGFSKQGAPIFLGCILLFGGSAGNILGGWLGDRLNRRWSGGRLLALVALLLVVYPFTVVYRFLPGDFRPVLAGCWFFGSILVTCMYGPVLATVQELTPVRLRATTVAFLLIGLNIFGASLGAIIAAWLTDVFDSYTWGIFVTAQASLLSIPLFLLAFRRYDADLARLTT